VIIFKAASRLHFLRILKKSGLNPQHLLHFLFIGYPVSFGVLFIIYRPLLCCSKALQSLQQHLFVDADATLVFWWWWWQWCSVVWHHGLSKTQCESLEAMQRRALPIICPVTVGMPILLWATHKSHLSTLAVKKLINDFSGTCLTLPLVLYPYCLHPETALLLPESDLQQSTLDQLLEQSVLHLWSNTQYSTVC